MPTYDYKCKKCHHQFEQFQSITSDPIKVCPVCGEESAIRKITGGAGLNFKGSGFYINDYKKSSGAASSKKTEKKSDK